MSMRGMNLSKFQGIRKSAVLALLFRRTQLRTPERIACSMSALIQAYSV